METVQATCPFCQAAHNYGAELIGRYTFCASCRGRFYVEVPTLEALHGDQAIVGPKKGADPRPDTTLDDVLWDTQQGTRYIIQSLRRQESAALATRWLVVGLLLIGSANLAGIVYMLLGR